MVLSSSLWVTFKHMQFYPDLAVVSAVETLQMSATGVLVDRQLQ